MIARSPSDAPPRPDLDWLRSRTLRGTRPVASERLAPAPASSSAAVNDFLSGRAQRPGRRSTATSSTPPSRAASPVGTSPASALDLSADPAPAPAAPARPPLTPAAPARTSLDLSPTATPTAATPAARRGAPPGRRKDRRPPHRAGSGTQTILGPEAPTVSLNRLQSGIGTLVCEAVCSPAVGDVRLGAAYQLSDGTSSIVQHSSGMSAAPAGSKRPVIAGSRESYDRLTIDLRQSRALTRMLVYAFSESGQRIGWGGTLRCSTFGGARIELPLELGVHQGPVALLSLYNVDGQYVLRAETELIDGEVREAAHAFGYDRITWADHRTPVQ